MKNHKKFILFMIGLCFGIVFVIFIQIYAKYLTTADGNTSLTIASWNILVNNLSIKNNTDISNSIVPVFPGNKHISSDIIAPTAEGYFDLNFDFSHADVSFKYEITTSADEKSSVKDLVATGDSVDDGEKINFQDFNEPISDTIELSSNIKKRKIRIYIMWNDNADSQSMDNTADTISTSSENPALFHVNISFTQITDNT